MAEFRYEKDMREPVIAWLEAQSFSWVREGYTSRPVDFIAGRFAKRVGRKRPALIEGMAVELKLDNVGEVLLQAVRNRDSVHMSYAAMPESRCLRMRPQTVQRFLAFGVGLLSVRSNAVTVLVAATRRDETDDYVARNLWRRVARKRRV